MLYFIESGIECGFIQKGQKLAWLIGTPAKNPKTYQWPKFIQLVSIIMLNCRAKNEVKIDQAILEIFHVKESSNLIDRKNFVAKTQEPDC